MKSVKNLQFMLLYQYILIFLLSTNINTSQDSVEVSVYREFEKPNCKIRRIFHTSTDKTYNYIRESYLKMDKVVLNSLVGIKTDEEIRQESSFNQMNDRFFLEDDVNSENTIDSVLIRGKEKIGKSACFRHIGLYDPSLNVIERLINPRSIPSTEKGQVLKIPTDEKQASEKREDKDISESRILDLDEEYLNELNFPDKICVKKVDDINKIIIQYIPIRDRLFANQGQYIGNFLLQDISLLQVGPIKDVSIHECRLIQINMRLEATKINLEKILRQKKELESQLVNIVLAENDESGEYSDFRKKGDHAFSILKGIIELYKKRIDDLEEFRSIFEYENTFSGGSNYKNLYH